MTTPEHDTPAPAEPGTLAGTEAPAPHYPRPHRWRRWAARTPWRLVAGVTGVAVLAFLGGVVTGRSMQVPSGAVAVATLERDVLPLVREGDSIWTGEGADSPAVATAVADVRQTGDPSVMAEHAASWLEAYDRLLVSMAAVDVPAGGRAVHRQFLHGLSLSRDAVEVLAQAAEAESTGARRLLVAEAIRLRSRSEFVSQSARTSLNSLVDTGPEEGRNTGVPPPLPSFDELMTPPRPDPS